MSKVTDKGKLYLLWRYDRAPELLGEYFEILKKFSTDKNSDVKSKVVALLINFSWDDAKEILLRLAKDNYYFVRTQAHDFLSEFEQENVKKFLENAIVKERTEFARRYAILSWAEITLSLQDDISEEMKFIQKQKKFQKTEQSILCCCYVEYLFGNKNVLKQILSFLNSENPYSQYWALQTLDDIMNEEHTSYIKRDFSI